MIPALFRLRSVTTPFAWQRHLTVLVWFAALGFCAWVVTDLFWRLAAPRPSMSIAVGESDPAKAVGLIGERRLFGASGTAPGTEDGGHIVLFGAVTGDERHPGFAILSIDGGPAKDVVIGQELAPGLVLSRIGPDRIELSGASGTRSVLLQTMRTGSDVVTTHPRAVLPAAGTTPAIATDPSRSVE
nr:hypothetical protein [Dechloromonas sp.]